jgi:regulator of PEP synthase PpsR (kinase-PPPase family)
MEKLKTLNLHLVSDGKEQTVKHVAISTLAQFDTIKLKKYYWSLGKRQDDLQNCLNKISAKPGIVLYTLNNEAIAEQLHNFCTKINVPCISAIDNVLNAFKKYLGIKSPNNQNTKLDKGYFDKIEAMNFSIKHDDGQSLETLDQADIIIVGPSRSSKTPTSMYLAYNGYKTANVPYVPGIGLPETLNNIKNILIVGLIVNPSRLSEIRYNRLIDMQSELNTDYVNILAITDECTMAKKTFLAHSWPIVDVTYKSIEETAAAIIKLYHLFKSRDEV